MAKRRKARASGLFGRIMSTLKRVGKELSDAQKKTSTTRKSSSADDFARRLGIGRYATESPIKRAAARTRAASRKRTSSASSSARAGPLPDRYVPLPLSSDPMRGRAGPPRLRSYPKQKPGESQREALQRRSREYRRQVVRELLESRKKGPNLLETAASTLISTASPALGRTLLGSNLTRSAVEIGRQAAKEPGRTASDAVTMTISGLAELPEIVTHPKKVPGLVEDLAKDVAKRYGPVLTGDTRKLRRILEEEGAAPYAIDAASVLTAGGATAGRVLGSAARAGKLGPRLRRFATARRPDLQLGGNLLRRQELARNLIVIAAQRALDRQRARRTARKAVSSGKGDGTGADALALAAARRGAVLPLNPRKIKRPIGRAKGALRLEQQALFNEMPRRIEGRLLSGLTRKERAAIKYAVQYGVRSRSRIREFAALRIGQIARARGADSDFRLSRLDHDELRTWADIAARPHEYFTPRVDAAANEIRSILIRTGRRDPTMAPLTETNRRRRQQAEVLGLLEPRRRADDDGISDLPPEPEVDPRVLRAARRQFGLDVAGYFPSRLAGPRRFGDWVGAFRTLVGPPRHRGYRGRLHALGIESNDPALVAGMAARNLSNELRLREVSRTIQEQAFPWSKSRRGKITKTANQLELEARRLGLDPTSWMIVFPRRVDKNVIGKEVSLYDLSGGGTVYDALTGAAYRPGHVPQEMRNVQGAVAIPRAVWDEVMKLEQPTSGVTRALNNLKGGWSRMMLGLNLTWLPFQVAGNTVMSMLAGAPPGMTRAFREGMRLLTPDERRRAEALLGIGQMSESFNRQHMGSQAGRLTRAWQELRQTGVGRTAAKLNPVRAMFALDRAQNNMFRRSVASAAMNRMLREAERGASILDRILMRGRPEDYARLLRDPERLERLADHVNKWLGDYTSLTALERRAVVPTVMFYGWLRHSLKLLFWTMPTNRPVTMAILQQLGKLHAQEIRELFGDDAPAWLFLYSILGETGDGRPIGINAARFIPFVNAIADAGTLRNPARSAVLALRPEVQAIANMAYGRDLFSGRFATRNPFEDAGLVENARLGARTLLATVPPYRIGERLINPRSHEEGRPTWQRALEQILPLPRPVPWSTDGLYVDPYRQPMRGVRGGAWGNLGSRGSWGNLGSRGSWGNLGSRGSWGGGWTRRAWGE